jgi:lupus La protein
LPAGVEMTEAIDRDSDLSNRIVSQVEFYLGDSNLPRDKFLREQAAKDADGWISIATIASFQRMRALSPDVSLIKSALKEAGSSVFEVDEEASNIRRKNPLPDSIDMMPKCVYVKGFSQDSTLDELLNFFRSCAPDFEAVRMRRLPKSKDFKGSVFVEFKSEAGAKAFLASPPKEYNTNPLIIMSKLAYFDSKNKTSGKAVLEAEFEKLANEYTKGCLVKLCNMPKGVSHQDVKETIGSLCEMGIAFVEQQQDSTTYVRLKEPKAQELVDTIEKDGLEIQDSEISAVLPSADEEAKYYRNLAAIMVSKKSSNKYRSDNRTRQASKPETMRKREAQEDEDDVRPENKRLNQDETPCGN